MGQISSIRLKRMGANQVIGYYRPHGTLFYPLANISGNYEGKCYLQISNYENLFYLLFKFHSSLDLLYNCVRFVRIGSNASVPVKALILAVRMQPFFQPLANISRK